MYIDKVNISETYEIVNCEKILRWKKIEANVNLSAGEDSMQGANFVQEFINEWNNRANTKQYPLSPEKCDPIVQQPEPKKTKEEGYIFLIENATSIKELESYRPLTVNNKNILEAYDKKLLSLKKQ